MDWNAELYAQEHDFVPEYGKKLLDFIPASHELFLLDLGCGTGELTALLARKAGHVIGIDASPEMIRIAKAKVPHGDFRVLDACALPWKHFFDVVFSNAVFHWIPDHGVLLQRIFEALKDGGKLVCEFGAEGNIRHIQCAFRAVLERYGHKYENPFFFPSVETYRHIMTQQGFSLEHIEAYDRPTPLKGGNSGLRNWLRQFFANDLRLFSEAAQEPLFEEMEERLRVAFWDGNQWIVDYRRLRVIAVKPAVHRAIYL